MSIIGNIIWIIFGGLFASLYWMLIGIVCFISVIGIPFGIQCFKFAKLNLLPFGRQIELGDFGVSGLLMNIIWIILFGWELALMHLSAALFFTLTIVGIPFAIQHIKLAKLTILPFGAKIA